MFFLCIYARRFPEYFSALREQNAPFERHGV